MTYVATDLSGSSKTAAAIAPRMTRTRPVSDQPMIASNPALTRANGAAAGGSKNNALLAGVGVVALLALGGGTWALTHRAASPANTPAAAAPVAPSTANSTTATPDQTSTSATAPIASKPVASQAAVDKLVTSGRAGPPVVSARAQSASRVAAVPAPNATPSDRAERVAPQPQAVTAPVISPAPEAVTPAPAQSTANPDASPAQGQPSPTTVQPVEPTTNPPGPTPNESATPTGPQPGTPAPGGSPQ